MKIIVILFLSFLFLSSCGSDKSNEVEELPHFVFAEPASPVTLDPRHAVFTVEIRLFLGLFEGLVTYNPETLEPVPGVAERWEISDDGLTYTFHLRDDAMWSDGTPITAQHFAHSWIERIRPDSGYLDYNEMNLIRGVPEYSSGQGEQADVAIGALSDSVFQFELSNPAPYYITLLSTPAFYVLPYHIIDELGDRWTAPENFVGNGPFVIESYFEEDRIVLNRSSTYWDRDRVNLGKVITLFIEDDEQILEMYRAGEIDWVVDPPRRETENLLNSPDFHLNPGFFTHYYYLNVNSPPLDNLKIRQAIALSVNRRELVETILEGRGIPAFSLTPPLHYYPEVKAMEENSDKSRELMAEAGYPGGRGLKELTLTFNNNSNFGEIAQYLSEHWKKELGITVVLNPLMWEDYLDSMFNQKYEMQQGGWIGDYIDPNSFLEIFITGSSTNWTGVTNSRYDSLMARAAAMEYGSDRFALLNEAEELILHEEVPIIPLYNNMNTNFIDTSVWGGWYENVLDWHPWKWIYKKEQ